MKVFSKVDPATYYIVTNSHVRICREGDKMTMAYGSVPEQSKRFIPEIQEELMGFYNEKHPLVECEYCGKPFHAANGFRYCSPECKLEAHRLREHKKKATMSPRKCRWCGITFEASVDSIKTFCSKKCRGENQKANYTRWNPKEETKFSKLNEKLQLAESKGMTYAEMQRQETLKMVGKVVI